MTTIFSTFVKLLTLQCMFLNILEVHSDNVKQTYYLRQFYGKCLEYDANRQVFVFATICREKFRWSSGAKIVHIATSKCLNVNSTGDGSYLTLANHCDTPSGLFQYDEESHTISHIISGKCLHPESNNIPASNEAVIIKSGCSSHTSKYWFRPTAFYQIRHFSSFCWRYDPAVQLIKLQDSHCDRFYYENDYRLKHVNTRKCVSQTESHHLTLTSDCNSVTNEYKLNKYSNIELSASRCIQPKNNQQNPLHEAMVTSKGCSDEDRIRFNFYDERGMTKKQNDNYTDS